jgi:hypothetical protein
MISLLSIFQPKGLKRLAGGFSSVSMSARQSFDPTVMPWNYGELQQKPGFSAAPQLPHHHYSPIRKSPANDYRSAQPSLRPALYKITGSPKKGHGFDPKRTFSTSRDTQGFFYYTVPCYQKKHDIFCGREMCPFRRN